MKHKMFFVIFSLFFFLKGNAQCAMCRAVLESEDGMKAAEGINNGIIYLMIIPYLLIGGLGFVIYQKLSKKK